MRLGPGVWVAAAAIGWFAIVASATRADDWKAEHDAGWNAYKEGKLDEAERHLKAAETQARALGESDPRLATTLDHLAWVLCAEGSPEKAEPLAKSALAIREKALGADHPEVVQSLNTLACILDAEGKSADARSMFAA
jgi:tetratricopeptide (TPR) repeat protein